MDPFPSVKRDLQDALLLVQQQYQTWQNTQKIDSPNHIAQQVQELLLDVADLEKAVLASEKQPARFGLNIAEVESRKRFVMETRKVLRDLNLKLQPTSGPSDASLPPPLPSFPSSQSAAQSNMQNPSAQFSKKAKYPPSDPYAHLDAAKGNNAYAEMETQQQQFIMREQDQQMDGVLSTVRNLKEMAHTIGDEVDDQMGLLDDVDERTDRTSGRLQQAQKRVDAVVKELQSGGMCTMICLIVVLFILLILVIVT
jgi:hypothetical protein